MKSDKKTVLEKMADDYYQKRPDGFGEPRDDFMAGFRAARGMAAKEAAKMLGRVEEMVEANRRMQMLGEDVVND